MTWNGWGSGWLVPSTETWRSAIASSSADCVLGAVRLISSARKSPVKTGPGRKVNVPVTGSYTEDPVMSAGSRSGVHCSRREASTSAVASVRRARVLRRPGTSSTSTWPPARIAASARRSGCVIPTTTVPTPASTASPRRATWGTGNGATVGSGLTGCSFEGLQGGEAGVQRPQGRCGAGGGEQGAPGPLAERGPHRGDVVRDDAGAPQPARGHGAQLVEPVLGDPALASGEGPGDLRQ